MRAIREILGKTSLRSSNCFPTNSGIIKEVPVIFPPGCARLATNPAATGSAAPAMTIGIVSVACLAAWIAAGTPATMTLTLRRTNSAARLGSPSYCPSAKRNTMAMFWPPHNQPRAGLAGRPEGKVVLAGQIRRLRRESLCGGGSSPAVPLQGPAQRGLRPREARRERRHMQWRASTLRICNSGAGVRQPSTVSSSHRAANAHVDRPRRANASHRPGRTCC
jgi:hypothetical protein